MKKPEVWNGLGFVCERRGIYSLMVYGGSGDRVGDCLERRTED